MALGEHVHGALLGSDNSLFRCLQAVESYDHQRWDDVDRFAADAGIAPAEIARAYQRAVQWIIKGAGAN